MQQVLCTDYLTFAMPGITTIYTPNTTDRTYYKPFLSHSSLIFDQQTKGKKCCLFILPQHSNRTLQRAREVSKWK